MVPFSNQVKRKKQKNGFIITLILILLLLFILSMLSQEKLKSYELWFSISCVYLLSVLASKKIEPRIANIIRAIMLIQNIIVAITLKQIQYSQIELQIILSIELVMQIGILTKYLIDAKQDKKSMEPFLLAEKFHKYVKKPQQYLLQRASEQLTPNLIQKFRNCLLIINNDYKDVPYHNLTHGFDVMTNIDLFMTNFNMKEKLRSSKKEYIAMLLAAYAHDTGHMGFTNEYYLKNGLPLAQRFPASPLENMHCQYLLSALRSQSQVDEFFKDYKKMMVSMILATDNMTNHKQMSMFMNNLEIIKGDISYQQQNKMLLREILIHAADITNSAKPLQLSLRWGQKIMEQFAKQNKQQCKEGQILNKSIDIEKQINFFNGLCLPLFKSLEAVDSSFSVLAKKVEQNRDYWTEKQKKLKSKAQ